VGEKVEEIFCEKECGEMILVNANVMGMNGENGVRNGESGARNGENGVVNVFDREKICTHEKEMDEKND